MNLLNMESRQANRILPKQSRPASAKPSAQYRRIFIETLFLLYQI